MGNTTSTNKKSLEHIVNYLVANYITKEDFEEMILDPDGNIKKANEEEAIPLSPSLLAVMNEKVCH